MTTYTVHVKYRTKSGCSNKMVRVDTDDISQAVRAASDLVRKQRGVIRIDSADARKPR